MRTLRATFASSALLALLAVTACGPAAPTGPASPVPTAGRPPGTSGYPGLDWGANLDDITGLHRGAVANGGGLTWTGLVEGRTASVQFGMDGDGLQQIDIVWDTFDSMDACGEALHQTRPLIDRRLGEGAEENLAVFWETATASVTLSCNIAGDISATLAATYQRKVSE